MKKILAAIGVPAILVFVGNLADSDLVLSDSLSAFFPLEKGKKWAYKGMVIWTAPAKGVVESSEIEWTMEVLEVYRGEAGIAAVVQGFLDELAWYEPGQQPGYSVIFSVDNRVYHLQAKDENDARNSAQRVVFGEQGVPGRDDLLLDLPLEINKRWGGDVEREDGWYCWCVEEWAERLLDIEGAPARVSETVFTLAYRTCPDHQILEFSPCIGILRYVYVHHGTTARADVRLAGVAGGEADVIRPVSIVDGY